MESSAETSVFYGKDCRAQIQSVPTGHIPNHPSIFKKKTRDFVVVSAGFRGGNITGGIARRKRSEGGVGVNYRIFIIFLRRGRREADRVQLKRRGETGR